MKKFFAVAVVTLMTIGVVAAQDQHATLRKDEVPAAVLQKFVAEFGAIPDGGTWTVTFVKAEAGSRLAMRPTMYTFRKHNDGQKIVVNFAPEGDVRSVKGIERKSGANG